MAHFYVLASLAGGYVSGLWYQRLHGDHWSLNTFLTALIFAGPVFCVWSIANTIAIFYNSTAAIPFVDTWPCVKRGILRRGVSFLVVLIAWKGRFQREAGLVNSGGSNILSVDLCRSARFMWNFTTF